MKADPTDSIPKRDSVFISYAHKDKRWLEQLSTHLKPLARGGLDIWDDRRIRAGDQWREEIENALSTARVAVLLVSPDFLASDFIANDELPTLLNAAREEGLRVVWVPLVSSSFHRTELKDFQAAIDPARPLKAMHHAHRDKALVTICDAIMEAYEAA